MSGHGGTDYSPDAGTGLLSLLSYKCWYAEFYVGKIPLIRIGAARLCSNTWYLSGFIHTAIETPLSKVHVLHREPFYLLLLLLLLLLLWTPARRKWASMLYFANVFIYLFIFLWPPYSPALVNGSSRKFYTW